MRRRMEPKRLAMRDAPARPSLRSITVVDGDLLGQDTDALVNPWNRNFVPRWLLMPSGVSGQLKRRTGPEPWKELAAHGLLPIGAAVVTDAGNWRDGPLLIHVAGLNAWWRATAASVTLSACGAVDAARLAGVSSLAMPLIGAGTGGLQPDRSLDLITTALKGMGIDPDGSLDVRIIRRRHDL